MTHARNSMRRFNHPLDRLPQLEGLLRHGPLTKQLCLAVVKIRAESRRERVVGGSCGFCLFGAAPGPIRPLPMTDPDGVPDFGLYRVVRLFFVRGGAASVESLWTILVRAAFGFRVRGPD